MAGETYVFHMLTKDDFLLCKNIDNEKDIRRCQITSNEFYSIEEGDYQVDALIPDIENDPHGDKKFMIRGLLDFDLIEHEWRFIINKPVDDERIKII